MQDLFLLLLSDLYTLLSLVLAQEDTSYSDLLGMLLTHSLCSSCSLFLGLSSTKHPLDSLSHLLQILAQMLPFLGGLA